MCIATIYKVKSGANEQVLEEVVYMDIEDGNINLTTILGEKQTLTGAVKHVDFLKHTVIIEPAK
jgi:predicted RNA-binding protein